MTQKLRDKCINFILLLVVPLEILPFLFEPKSLVGKLLMLIKAAVCFLLYILLAEKQKWYTHVMLAVVCVSIGISTVKHGNAGANLLILIMFGALIAFPRIEIRKHILRDIYVLLASGAIMIAMYGMLSNYSKGLPTFSWRGTFNSNTFGILLLAAFYFFESSLHLDDVKFKVTFFDVVTFSSTLILILKCGCRSALLALLIFVIGCFIFEKKTIGMIFYFSIAIFSIGVCFVIYYIQKNPQISSQVRTIEILGKGILSGREKIWSLIFQGFLESPIWGQSIEYIYKPTGLESAHSVFMGVLLSTGILPSLAYILLLFSPRRILSSEINNLAHIQTQKICFTASILITAFECLFTDNRLNFLFLPLLFSGQQELVITTTNELAESKPDGMLPLQTKQVGFSRKTISIISLIASCLSIFVCYSEPVALQIIHENLPCIVTAEYLNDIGYDETINENVLGHQDYPSERIKGVAWEWNGSSYDVIGQTNTTDSFVDFYRSFNSLPEWAIPGKTYHAIFEGFAVRLRICCYDIDGNEIMTIDTRHSIDFTIPIEAVGIVVRIDLNVGEPAYESVMPIIYPLESNI